MNKGTVARTLAERVYANIRNDIVDGILPAGSKLRMEALSRKYDVGLTPLREALARLVGDEFVRSEGQRGFWVAELSIEEHEDLSAMRCMIETEALSRSIERGDDAWEANLKKSFDDLTRIETSLPENANDQQLREWEAANEAFHQALVASCGSYWLIKIRDILHRQAERYRHISLSVSYGNRCLHDEHEGIYLAAINRQAIKASRLTEAHINKTAAAVRQALRDNTEAKESA